MKSWIILVVLAVVLTAAFTVALPFLSSASLTKELAYPAPIKTAGLAPSVEVAEDLIYNFGALPQLHTGHHTWTFKNKGEAPLELRGASKTCSCTSADLFGAQDEKQISIAPGESLPIDVTFHTKEWNTEKWGQSVTVGTNDPKMPTVVLRVEGVIKPAITTVPADPSMSYGVVSNEDEMMRKIALYSIDRPDLKVIKVTTTNPNLISAVAVPLNSEQAASIKAEKGYAIEVTLKPSTNLGAFAEEVTVETDHPKRAELKFKVAGKVTGAIACLPERVTVRGATAGGGGAETLKLLARGRTSVHFTVEKKPAGFEVAIDPITQPEGSKSSMYRMTVKVVPNTLTGRIVDEIVLKTDDPKIQELKIPVDVIVQGAR